MKPSRSSMTDTLRAEARRDVPPPSGQFLEDLERRLLGAAPVAPTATNVLPFRRRISRGVAIGVVAAVVSGAGAAAVAIVHVARNETAQAPDTTIAPTTSVAPATTTPATTTPATTTPATAPATTTPATTPPTTTATATTTPASTAPATAVVPALAPPITVAPETTQPRPTEPAPTEPASTAPPSTVPPSTEVQTPATIELACTAADAAIACTWSPGPAGTDHYVLLRSTPSEAHGRVLQPAPGETSFVDTTVTAGQPYTYLVHAMDASGHSVAHSTFAQLTCCG